MKVLKSCPSFLCPEHSLTPLTPEKIKTVVNCTIDFSKFNQTISIPTPALAPTPANVIPFPAQGFAKNSASVYNTAVN